MWLGYQKDLLALVADTKEELENTPMMTFTSIVETSDTYVLVNGQYVKESEAATMPIAEPKTASAAFSVVPASAGGGDSNMLATNCITKIPQDINLQLSADGTLTLKSGSKVYDGAGNVVSINSDKTTTSSSNGKSFALLTSSGATLTTIGVGSCTSGETDSLAGQQYHLWYDTANKVVNYYGQDGSTVSNTRTLPIALITVSGGKITSIDQVFNGFGYIGSTVFGLPGVKVLMPNGRNEDGTLKNLEITTNSVVLNSTTQTYIDNAHYNCVLNNDADQIHTVESGYYYYTYERPELGANKRWYSEKDNMWYTCFAATPTVWTGDTQCIVLTYTYHESSPISDFEIKAPISVVNQSMSDYVVSSFVDATTGQWYRIYKSGWLEQGGIQTQGSGFTFSLIKPFLNTKYFVSAQMVSNSPNTNNVFVSFLNLRAQTTTYFQLEFTTYSDTVWYACGQGA